MRSKMPSIVGEEVFELKDFQVIGTNSVLNVYAYMLRAGQPSPTAADVAQGFETDVITPMLPFQHDSLEHITIEIRELLTDDNFAEFPTGLFGTRLGSEEMNFVALSVRLNRATRETRNGFKRIGGMVKDDAVQNLFTQVYVDDFTTAMNDPMLTIEAPASTALLDLVILRKTAPGSPVILPEDEWSFNSVTSIFASRVVKHQATRLVNRGS